MVKFRFGVPNRNSKDDHGPHSTWFHLAADHSVRRSRALTRACRQIVSALDVPFDVDETGDD
ncbi:hypothetical protein [Burkholderia contaminans]|uniref:Uncharacterized protein n=1 Tax=Burkholderia contaminans TaxID=488447 RepID=A0A3N8Q1X1_9BURK|nr:hypothetical protein [Burkholderia contaminans]RQT17858.1 hypothetical protein DF051_10295 [Burkholderia contaminans]